MKILFFGTDYYSTLVLPHLIDNPNNQIVGVVTNNKKPSLPFAYESVYEYAQKNSLKMIIIDSKTALLEKQDAITELQPDIGLVASFGYLIPQSIYTIPQHGTLNIHPSLLPEYRGVSPMQQAILDGKTKTGVTIMHISESFDTGPILSQTELTIDRTETTHTLALKAFPAGTLLFNDLLQRHPDGKFPEKPQAEEQSSYTRTVDKADSYIDFSCEESELIDRKIRAYYPKPLAWGYLDQIVQFFNPHVTTPQKWSTKRVLLHNSSIEGSSLVIDRLQIEGKEPIDWKQFEMGYLRV